MKYSVQAQIKIFESTISGNQDIGILLSNDIQAEIQDSKILGNQGWGIAAFIRDCFPERRDVLEKFEGAVTGRDNEIYSNGAGLSEEERQAAGDQGDLCPPYPGPPWPEGFIKERRVKDSSEISLMFVQNYAIL